MAGRVVVFDSIIDEIPGGVALNVARLDNEREGKEFIEPGTPVYVDYAARTAEVCKTALAIDGGLTAAPRISKNNHFLVGDILNDGTTGGMITAIDRDSSDDYDTVTLNANLTYAAGTKYFEGSATGTSDVLKYTPNGLIKSVSRIKEGNAEVSVVTMGAVREDALTYPMPTLFKTALRSATGTSLITFFD